MIRKRFQTKVGTVFFVLFLLVSFTSLRFAAAQTPSATFVVSNYPLLGNSHIAVDLNGDGILDLAGPGAAGAAVMLGNADGTFRARVDFPAGGQTQDLAAGDFNSDGKPDLAITINSTQIGLSLLTGKGDGTFNAPVDFPNTSGFDAPAIVAADVNNDTRLDILIAHQIACFTAPCVVSDDLTVMLGNGDGTFQTSQMDVGIGMSEIAVGDFNRDGFKDLAIAGSSARLYLLQGNGNGTFTQQPTLQLITEDPFARDGTDVDVGDFNRDGIQDLVAAVALNGSKTVVLIGNGDGSFRTPSVITEPATRIPHYQAVADYNGDGSQDLALSLGWGFQGMIEILNGNGDGTFQPLALYDPAPADSSTAGGHLIAGDFNRDGRPDLALQVRGAFPAMHILINTTNGGTAPPTPTPLPAPTLLSPANNEKMPINQSLPFSWSAVPGAATYEIQFDDSSSFTTPLFAAQTGLTQTHTTQTFTSERRFWWRVRARTAGQANGTWSTARSIDIKRDAPPLPTATPLPPTPTAAALTSTATPTPTSALPTATSSPPTATPTRAATPTAPTDTVSIQLAEYSAGNRALRVEATGSNASATLTAYVASTNTLIGTLRNEGGGRYRGDFSWATSPQTITVRSSLGGSASRTVILK
jgi:hypothetical protein